MIAKLLSRPVLAAGLVSLVCFIVYQFTLSHSVDFIDAGELATVCATLGIAHPTGYPLFAMVGWLFAHIPFASSVILRLNEMAALFTALGAGTITLLAHEIFLHWFRQPAVVVRNEVAQSKRKAGKAVATKRSEGNSLDPAIATIAAILVGVAAGFSATWWAQSTAIEVYPIQLFLLPLILLFLLRMLRLEGGPTLGRDGKLFAVLLGLAFANHMTTVLLAPASIYAFFARYGVRQPAWRRILSLAPYFIAALLLYLYLPLRSSQYPIMDWGHPATLPLFLKHVTGGQYKIWMFQSGSEAAKQWAYFWHRAPIEFTLVGGLLALSGIYGLFRSVSVRGIQLLVLTLLMFFGCLLYSINYSIHDIDSYFLLAYMAVAIWIGAGAVTIASMTRRDNILIPIAAGILVLGTCELGLNFSDADESGNRMVEDYTLNMLHNLPPKAIVFSTQWDFWVSGAYYYQIVEKIRPDVLVIDKAMLRDRPWYFEHIRQRAPEVMARQAPETNAFLRYLRAFDLGENAEAGIAESYAQFTEALVERNLDRPIYVTQEMFDEPDDLFANKMKMVPAGIAYRLLPHDSLLQVPAPNLQWHDANYRKREYYTDNARLLQAIPLVMYAQKLMQSGNTSLATQYLDQALKLKPDLTAKIDDLPERDRSIAEAANQRFTQIQTLRNSLSTHP